MNRLDQSKRKAVIAALVGGASINSTVRMTSVSRPTILKLIQDLGVASQSFHDEHVRGLKSEHVQTDEIWSFNYCRAKSVTTARRARGRAGDVWTWTAIDSDSKLMISYRVGVPTQENANEFMLDLAGRVAGCTQLTTDGHTTYLSEVQNVFGFEVDYAQVVEPFGPESAGKGAGRKYSPGKCDGTKKIKQIGLPGSEQISTSHVERHNLTIGRGMRRFTRLTNAHSKRVENHAYAVSMFFMYYNYCRVHSTIGASPAVKDGLADYPWTIEEMIGLLR